MRPLRLEMEGFGTFSQRTTVDFVGADFFALVGPTGAGKSTVMDAICFSLYGRVPRWGTGIEYSLAPSATSGKVQLVFSAAGRVYVATRVVKRGGKGRVSTASAALERLPADVDPASPGDIGGVIGTSLAGSAKSLTDQVERIIGLPFEQFTKCVLLPQGAFADFLHSSATERRKILESLLGYSVYREIQTAAGEEQRQAEAVLGHIDSQLAQSPQVTDTDLSTAKRRIEQLHELDGVVRETVPKLAELARRAADSDAELKIVDEEHSLLTYIRQPNDVDSIAGELAETAEVVEKSRQSVLDREEVEERLRTAAGGVDVARIEQLLADYAADAELAEGIAKGTPMTEAAEERVAEAQRACEAARTELTEAESAHQAARDADLAASLRANLTAGDACPVCERPITADLADHQRSDVDRARQGEAAARKAVDARTRDLSTVQTKAIQYRSRLDELVERRERLTEKLRDAPTEAELKAERETAEAARSELTQASTAVRVARDELRRAEKTHSAVQDRLTSEWQRFDHHRDRVARLAPPPTDRADLRAAWRELSDWATEQLAVRKKRRAAHLTARAELDERTRIIRNELSARLIEAEVPFSPSSGTEDFSEIVTAERHAATSRLEQLTTARDRHIDLARQRSEQAGHAEVAKHLHQHLGTRQFVSWLLTEALEDLVDGASRILYTLTSGQYDLAYVDGEFYVIDHHDADLTRPVKTLSGGETFAASLSLALAMSDQLAGMSSQGACLEAILLDEGFGTLDAATLDQVAANLENLATSGSRMVGVVTHVAGLAERIPVRYEVEKNASGSHVTRVDV